MPSVSISPCVNTPIVRLLSYLHQLRIPHMLGQRQQQRHCLEHHVGGLKQGVLAQVGIALGSLDLGVAQYFLHFIQRPTCIDQERGKAVAQVMNAHIPQPYRLTRRVPRVEDADISLLGFWVGKHMFTALTLRYGIQ